MHIAIIGYGFLGAELTRQATQHPTISQISILTRHLPNEKNFPAAHFYECDISSPESLAKLPDFQPDWLIHCASSSRGGADAYRSVYLEGCQFLQQKFPNSRILFCSSSSVYAQNDGSWVTELSPAIPARETGEILKHTEQFVLANNGGVARLAGLYGHNRSVLLRKFLQGNAIIEENGQRYLNQIHCHDAASALLFLLQHGDRTPPFLYNVCDSTPTTQLECYTFLAQTLSREIPPSGPRDLNRKRGWTHKRVANQKLLNLGWLPQFPSFFDALPTLLDASSDTTDA